MLMILFYILLAGPCSGFAQNNNELICLGLFLIVNPSLQQHITMLRIGRGNGVAQCLSFSIPQKTMIAALSGKPVVLEKDPNIGNQFCLSASLPTRIRYHHLIVPTITYAAYDHLNTSRRPTFSLIKTAIPSQFPSK